MHENTSQLNTQKGSPWGPMAATAKEQEGKQRWHQRGEQGHTTTGEQLFLLFFLPRWCCWQWLAARASKNQSAPLWISQGGRGEGHTTKYFPHTEIKKPEALYKNQP